MSSISAEEITVTLNGNFDSLSVNQKDSLKKLFIFINARHKKLDEDVKVYFYNLNSSINDRTFEVSGLKNQNEEQFLQGLNELQSLNPRVSPSTISHNKHPLNVCMGISSVNRDSGLLDKKVYFKGGKIRKTSKKLRGGNCGVVSSVQQPSCLPTPNLEMYKYPCSQLTDNQFGFKDMQGLVGGSRKKKQTAGSKKKRYIKKGGSCGEPVQHCLGSSYANLGKTAISDGAPTDHMTASEGAWFNRYTFGGVSSTNEVPQPVAQKGGAYSLNLSEKIGGLAQVSQSYDDLSPSTTNLQIRSVNPSQNVPCNVLNYNERLNFVGGTRKRNSKKNIKGGNAPFPSSFSNEVGNFSQDMMTHKFNCAQPQWSKDCS
jgi:hypothetical protein